MRKKFRNAALFALMLAVGQAMLTGCKDYDSDISNLQEQITAGNEGLAKLESTLSAQLSSANTLAKTAQTLAENAQASADEAAQKAEDATDEAQKAILLAQSANDRAESAKQEAIAESAAQMAEEIEKLLVQINANGKKAEDALAATVANAQNIASLEGKLSTLQEYVNGLNILSSADVVSLINNALKDAGLDELPSQVSELYKTVEDLAAEQQNIQTQLATLAKYESKISALESKVGSLEKIVANLQNSMDEMGESVAQLKESLTILINANTAQINKVAQDLATEAGKITALQALVTTLQADLQEVQSGMLTKEDVNSLIGKYLSSMDYITGSSLASTLKGYATQGDLQSLRNALNDYITSEELNSTLTQYVKSTDLNNILKNYSTTSEMQSYVSQEIASAITASENNTKEMIESYLKNYVSTSTYTSGIQGLQSQIDTLNSSINNIQSTITSIQSSISNINGNLLTLQTDMLRGLIFLTDVYVGGIPALDYQVVNYGTFSFANANNAVTASLTYPGATTTSSVTVPTATASNPIYTAANTPSTIVTANFFPTLEAMYTLNPSSAVVNANQLSIVTRGVTTRAEDNDVLGTLNIENATTEDGVLTLELKYDQPNLPSGTTASNTLSGNYFAGTHNNMLFSLVAEFNVVGENEDGQQVSETNTVTSDWGLFNPVKVTLSEGGSIVYANPSSTITPIDDPNYSINLNKGENLGTVNQTYNPLYYTNLEQVTDATSSVSGLTDALTNAPTAMVPYNSSLNLNEQVLVAFTIEASDKNYYFTLSPEELEQYDMTMNYRLINYTIAGQTYGAGHTAGESSYASLNDGVLTPNPQAVGSLGHMPVVMLYVTDKSGKLVALSFLKVIISLPQTEAPAINTIDLGVYPFNPGGEEYSTVTVNYSMLAKNSESAMTITENQWINNYVSAPTIELNPAITNYGTITKTNGVITWTLEKAADYIAIWQAANHTVEATLTFKSNISNLGDIVVPLQLEVARAQVPLGEKIPNVWSSDYSFALATLNVRNSGQITTDIDQFSVLLPSLFNGKQVLGYNLSAIASNPGPIMCDGNQYGAGLFPSLQLQNAKPLTIANNAWTLTQPGTNLTLPSVAYNFYLNQLNNTTVTISNGYYAGTYTLAVANKAASQLNSDYVLNNPFAVVASGTEYNNVVVTATKAGTTQKHTILTLDQTSGAITIGANATGSTTPDPVALAILNEQESTNLQSLLSAQIGVSAWGNNGYAVSVLDNLFAINFLRPINITPYTPAPLKWNQRPLDFYISDCLTIQDIPGATFTSANYNWFDAYQIDLDIPNATYTVEGKTYNVSNYLSVTSGSTTAPKYDNAFTGQPYTASTTSQNVPVSVWGTSTSGMPNYGTITFDTANPNAESNLVITRLTTVEIPAALTYSWGSIFFTITINVEPLQ